MTFFFFLSLAAYLRFVNLSNKSQRAWPLYVLSLVLYTAALLTKTTACTMPAALVLLLWFKRISLNRNRWLQIIPYVVLGLTMGLLTLWWELHHQGTTQLELGMGMLDRILLASRAIWFYLVKLAWPVNLTFSYPKWQLNVGEPLQYLWVLACVAAGLGLWYWRKQLGRGTIAAVLFFVATLFPMLGIFPLYTFRYTYVADHYQYLACIGPIALVSAGGYYLAKHHGLWLRIFAIIIAGSALTSLGLLTWQQSCAYKDEKTLWEDALRKNPQSFMAYNNLGTILCSESKFDTAITYFRKAIQIFPEYAEGYNNLAYALATLPHIRTSDPNEPILLAIRAIKLQRYADPSSLDTLAAAYASAGQFDKAVINAQKAFDLAAAAKNKKLTDEIKIKLDLYRQGKPYRISVERK
jgi:protein O-mannosyl-transferase